MAHLFPHLEELTETRVALFISTASNKQCPATLQSNKNDLGLSLKILPLLCRKEPEELVQRQIRLSFGRRGQTDVQITGEPHKAFFACV